MDKKLRVIVPYRNRQENLEYFVPYMYEYLRQQHLDFRIMIIEQVDNKLFNRSSLINIGYDLCKNDMDYMCTHDVDLLPIGFIDYSYKNKPTHAISKIYRMDKKEFRTLKVANEPFGGVVFFNKEAFKRVNGFTNKIWGHGGGDSDCRKRFEYEKIEIDRMFGSYMELIHPKAWTMHQGNCQQNIKNYQTLHTRKNKNHKTDGLNTLTYKIVQANDKKYYTIHKVEINNPEISLCGERYIDK